MPKGGYPKGEGGRRRKKKKSADVVPKMNETTVSAGVSKVEVLCCFSAQNGCPAVVSWEFEEIYGTSGIRRLVLFLQSSADFKSTQWIAPYFLCIILLGYDIGFSVDVVYHERNNGEEDSFEGLPDKPLDPLFAYPNDKMSKLPSRIPPHAAPLLAFLVFFFNSWPANFLLLVHY